MTASFITCYRRLYVDIRPFLVILSNLAKGYFIICHLDKNGVLHVKLTFETTLIFLYKLCGPIFKSYFCRPYIACIADVSDTIISCKDLFNVCDLDKNSVLSPILTFCTAPIFLYER